MVRTDEPFKSGFIALIGRPNAGKSTLLNTLLGQKVAIISAKPQTTRNKIVGVLTKPQHQLIFLDTPGIHKPLDKLGQVMVETALHTLREVDLIYYLVDAAVPFGGGEAFILEKLEHVQKPVFLLLNKIDRLKKPELLPLIDFYRKKREWAEIVPLSALTGENLDRLLEVTLPYLEEGPQYYPSDALTDQPERVILAELIREKIILATHQEIPHSVAVLVELMEERAEDLFYIGATIFVEHASQKAILIGKQGERLKEIGTQARQEIEKLLGTKAFLELWVKVKADWRNSPRNLREFGYTAPE
ncbi:MAG TPA: GTPase Era [Peptococcaceae bacterium]|jgi:GTP-binding protein Era|nr:GTPase Era [Clostridia bacterium]HOB82294.1 GTPase Era [Peptococcaceae bacterium]HPZ70698.1 GTPase Era [Peptococcaceae bacterium]HQD54068.1 GTPase Era [Peptococcaceae bacterium]